MDNLSVQVVAGLWSGCGRAFINSRLMNKFSFVASLLCKKALVMFSYAQFSTTDFQRVADWFIPRFHTPYYNYYLIYK